MSEVVLDASALLALVNEEPGGEKGRPFVAASLISAVNFCETVQRLRRGGMPIEAVTATLSPLVSEPVPFDESLAYVTASVHEKTRHAGLSFGDCACLALDLSRKIPAVTAEREWGKVDVGIRVIRIR